MTHILITDLREIRYMAYVPEEPKYCIGFTAEDRYCLRCNSGRGGGCEDDKIKYERNLEKAKRESLPFENLEDREKVLQVLYGHTAHLDLPLNYQKWKEEIKPGIYQVPVEVEVAYYLPWRNEFVTTKDCVFNKSEATKVVARIVQPKEESQEDLMYDLLTDYKDMECTLGEAITKLSAKFNVTRKRG